MANLLPQTSKKSPDPQTERVMRARAGMASFSRAIADQGNVQSDAQPARKAFLSGLGGVTDAPTAKSIALAQKADILDALPANARKASENFDQDTQRFVNMVYQVHKDTGEHVAFTAAQAGTIMKRDAEQARRCVEALVSKGILKPSYSPMGSLKGYVPAITN